MRDVPALVRALAEEPAAGDALVARLREQPPPDRVAPQLARVDGTPLGDGWLLERKLDGIRLLAHVDPGHVRLRTRPGSDRTAWFPELAAALGHLDASSAVLDAEVVALDGDRTSFGRLQRRLGRDAGPGAHASDVPVHLYVFDLLHLDGFDLRDLPLLARKALLARLELTEPVRLVTHWTGPLDDALRDACDQGWEGLVAKRADAPYRSGRGDTWRKFRCHRVGRFVVVGWTEPRDRSAGFGALALGRMGPDGLRYAGRVGTGFDAELLATLGEHLRRVGPAPSPFDTPPDAREVHWTVPHLVIEVRFAGWTEAGRVRHASLVRLRPDLVPAAATGDAVD